MAHNIVVRRAAKAQRRKAVMVQKRRTELEAGSLVRLDLADPIQHCLLFEGLFQSGTGILVLTRGPTAFDVTMATFLLDSFERGVKDVYLRSLGGADLAEHLEHMGQTTPMAPVDPSYAQAGAWACGLGALDRRCPASGLRQAGGHVRLRGSRQFRCGIRIRSRGRAVDYPRPVRRGAGT